VDKSGVVKTSAGEVTSSVGDALTLTPASGPAFTVTVTAAGITAIAGTVTFTDNTTAAGGTLTPFSSDAEIEITEAITEDRVLGVPGMAVNYVWNGNMLAVNSPATLTILPGTTVRFANTLGRGGIEVKTGATIKALGEDKLRELDATGKLSATPGTKSGHIQFTGYNATVGAGSWDRIYLDRVKTPNEFVYCDFINGGNGNIGEDDGVLNIYNSTVGISHCTVTGAKVHGIALYDDFTLTAFDNNTVENCAAEPVWFRGELSRLAKFDVTTDFTNNTKPYILVFGAYVTEAAATLNETSVPYYFNCNLQGLEENLTVGAGVTIYMGSNRDWLTGDNANYHTGRLLIHGTPEKKVKFTRIPNTTYHWQGIIIFTGAGHEIKNCIVEYGGENSLGNITVRGRNTSMAFENVQTANSKSYGVKIENLDGSWTGGNTVTFGTGANANTGGNVWIYSSTTPYYKIQTAMPDAN
jgi:plastocyanin